MAARSREGLKFEEGYQKSSNALIAHLKGKPECRELLNEILTGDGSSAAEPRKEASLAVPATGATGT